MKTKNETSKIKHREYSSGSSVRELGTEILAENLTICEDWSLSIDLKLTNRSTTERRNIFSLYVNKNTGQLNHRILAVSMRPNQPNVMLMVVYNFDNSQSYKYNITKNVNANNWINLKISQISGIYEIEVDYKLVYNKSTSSLVPITWTNVNLVTGKDNGKGISQTIVYYRNFKINTCKTRGKLRKITLCCTGLQKTLYGPKFSFSRYFGN